MPPAMRPTQCLHGGARWVPSLEANYPGGDGGRVEAGEVRLADDGREPLPEQDDEGHVALLPPPR